MLKYLRLFRAKHYIKNVFIFLPIFFSVGILNSKLILTLSLAFCGFSLMASAIYILNDIKDRKYDKLHPEKKLRPIASGEVKIPHATYFAFGAGIVGGGLLALSSVEALLLGLLYVVMNILYTFKLKDIAVVDVFVIAIGFVIRIFIGAVVAGVNLHHWMIVMTFLLALFLGFAKRRDDVIANLQHDVKYRKSIQGYDLQFVDYVLVVLSGVIITAYLIYTLSPDVEDKMGSTELYLTSIFVILGVLRYLQITFVEKRSGSPTDILLKDRLIQFAVICWLLLFGILLYLL